MKRLAFPALLLAAAAAAPCAGAEQRQVDAALEIAKSHEECQRIEAGQKRKYHWKASAPVDFNIHYHDGPEVLYGVKRDAMRGDGGTFTAKTAQDYCWMWTARNAPAKVEGRIELK